MVKPSTPLSERTLAISDEIEMTDEDSSSTMNLSLDVDGGESLHWTKSERRLWVLSLFIGQAALFSTRALLPVCSVAISKEFGWDKAQMGAVMGAFFWGYLMTQFLSGHLADKIGGEKVLTLGAMGWTVSTLAYPCLGLNWGFPNIIAVMISLRVLHGLFQGFHSPSVGSLMASRVPLRKRGKTFTIQRAGSYVGVLTAGSLGSLLLEISGWRAAFFVLGTVCLVWTITTRWLLLTSSSWIYPTHVWQWICKIFCLTPSDTLPTSPTPKLPTKPPIQISLLVKRTEFWAMLVGHYAYGHSHYILLSWLPTYFHDTFPDAKGWIFNVVPWMVTIPSSLAGGLIADHMIHKGYSVTFVRKVLETAALLGTALFLVVIAWTTTFTGSLFCMALAVAFSGFHCSGIMLNPQDLAPQNGGALFGIMNMAGGLPGFLGVYIAGFVLQRTKSWAAVFQQTAVVNLVGWVVYILFGSAEQII